MNVAFIVTNANTSFCLKIASTFDQDLAILGPDVSDQDLKLLRARWAGMKSESDYERLEGDLNVLAKEERSHASAKSAVF